MAKNLALLGLLFSLLFPKPVSVVTVSRVVDGDTIVINTGEKVRLIGINTPETVDPRASVQCFGKEASDYAKNLLTGSVVTLEKDISDKDKYGRLLRYVYKDGQLVNELLVHEGFARVATYPPDVKYQQKFQEAEKFARTHNLGLWNKCLDSIQ